MSAEKPQARYNHLTNTYDTPDGTKVGTEIFDSVCCLADVFYICEMRQRQREAAAPEVPR